MCVVVVVVTWTQVGRERKEREREKRKSTLSIPSATLLQIQNVAPSDTPKTLLSSVAPDMT
jgi:hypothetical protein